MPVYAGPVSKWYEHRRWLRYALRNRRCVTCCRSEVISALDYFAQDGGLGRLLTDIEQAEAKVRALESGEPLVDWQAMTLPDAQYHLVRAHLLATNGNRKQTAERIGIGERTLARWLVQMGARAPGDRRHGLESLDLSI